MRSQPPITIDNKRISLNINAGLTIEVGQIDETGADAVGLFRTEIPFMVRSELPNVAAPERIIFQYNGALRRKKCQFSYS